MIIISFLTSARFFEDIPRNLFYFIWLTSSWVSYLKVNIDSLYRHLFKNFFLY